MKSGLDDNVVLTPLQKGVLRCLFAEPWFASSFHLTGGTALSAFYLQHRDSEDLDLFSHEDFPPRFAACVREILTGAGYPTEVVKEAPFFARLLAQDTLKIDLVRDTAFRFGVPKTVEFVAVDTIENIAVNKVCAILGRLEAKDYIDLLFLIRDRGFSILDLIEKGKKKDGGMEAFTFAQIIGDVENLSVLPRMRKPLSIEELRDFFRDLRVAILQAIRY